MEQNTVKGGNSANQTKDFLVIPLAMAEFIYNSRKFRAFELLFRLKIAFPAGQIPTRRFKNIAEIGLCMGIKSKKTLKKHLDYLAGAGFITTGKTGVIHLWSLFKRFRTTQTGIRVYATHPDKFRSQLFQGLSFSIIQRGKFIRRLSRCEKQGRTPKGKPLAEECTSGVAVKYLSHILNYSPVRISQMKKSGCNLKTRHRYGPTLISFGDINEFRNHDPGEGKKLVRRKGRVWRQLIDSFEFAQPPELVRRKTA